jgi:hypothetical protein
MESPGEKLLAGACLSLQENRNPGARHPVENDEHLL